MSTAADSWRTSFTRWGSPSGARMPRTCVSDGWVLCCTRLWIFGIFAVLFGSQIQEPLKNLNFVIGLGPEKESVRGRRQICSNLQCLWMNDECSQIRWWACALESEPDGNPLLVIANDAEISYTGRLFRVDIQFFQLVKCYLDILSLLCDNKMDVSASLQQRKEFWWSVGNSSHSFFSRATRVLVSQNDQNTCGNGFLISDRLLSAVVGSRVIYYSSRWITTSLLK